MNLIENPAREAWASLLARPIMDHTDLFGKVEQVMKAVQNDGDKALRAYTQQFDGVTLAELGVDKTLIEQAGQHLSPPLIQAIQQAYENIKRFHAAQAESFDPIQTMPGVTCWRRSIPIERVGLYIPGGSAPLFSTVLMLGVPAQLAGCKEVVLCTPPQADGSIHPAILYAANLAGIHQIFQVGGSQAIAAMTYGTASIPQVYKIFGPGNQYVTAAKQLASQQGVAIDMPAGPSEVMVVADESAHPAFVAADLLSQAEHGPDSQVVLIVNQRQIGLQVIEEIEQQVARLPRKTIAEQALAHSRMLVLSEWQDQLDCINEYAPEHLILAVAQARELGEAVINAGSVFLGHYTPESLGDYASGTNHTLPTNGYARAYAGVSLDAFIRKVTYQEATPAGLQLLGPHVAVMAEAEQLAAHRAAVTIRLDSLAQS